MNEKHKYRFRFYFKSEGTWDEFTKKHRKNPQWALRSLFGRALLKKMEDECPEKFLGQEDLNNFNPFIGVMGCYLHPFLNEPENHLVFEHVKQEFVPYALELANQETFPDLEFWGYCIELNE